MYFFTIFIIQLFSSCYHWVRIICLFHIYIERKFISLILYYFVRLAWGLHTRNFLVVCENARWLCNHEPFNSNLYNLYGAGMSRYDENWLMQCLTTSLVTRYLFLKNIQWFKCVIMLCSRKFPKIFSSSS